tara:strand:+ start:360 stop:611 length:252 start_codon:yes stop_codon:yes gene_type:complete
MKKKIKSDKTCTECGYDPEDHYFEGKEMNLYKHRKRDRKLVKEYCENHKMTHSNDKCKPIWRECCGILDSYSVQIIDSKKKLW